MSEDDRLPGQRWSPGDSLCDVPETWPVRETTRPYEGFTSVREDVLLGPDDDTFTRAVLEHPGSVGILTVDDSEPGEARVLLLRQYRHAAGHRLLEVPAGLLDVEQEEPEHAAARELAEEASLQAQSWSLLLSGWPSPGISDEHWQVYEARDLSAVPVAERTERVHEEADMTALWVPLSVAVDAVLEHRLGDAMATAALLALAVRRQRS